MRRKQGSGVGGRWAQAKGGQQGDKGAARGEVGYRGGFLRASGWWAVPDPNPPGAV